MSDNVSIWTILEGVLNDDELIVPDPGYYLSGGYAAAVRHWTYRNPWANDAHVRRFRTRRNAHAWLTKHYAGAEGVEWGIINDALS